MPQPESPQPQPSACCQRCHRESVYRRSPPGHRRRCPAGSVCDAVPDPRRKRGGSHVRDRVRRACAAAYGQLTRQVTRQQEHKNERREKHSPRSASKQRMPRCKCPNNKHQTAHHTASESAHGVSPSVMRSCRRESTTVALLHPIPIEDVDLLRGVVRECVLLADQDREHPLATVCGNRSSRGRSQCATRQQQNRRERHPLRQALKKAPALREPLR